MIKMKQINN